MTIHPQIQQIFERKEARRKELAKLPFPEKIEIVKRLNELAEAKRTGKIKFKSPASSTEATPPPGNAYNPD